MAWRVADALKQLKEEIDRLAPTRSVKSDGTIGDADHASRASDHNPWVKDVNGVGVVTAMDITHDPDNGLDAGVLAQSLTQDARVKYVIFNRKMWRATTGRWEAYSGTNPHTQHVHVSIHSVPSFYDSKEDWLVAVCSPFSTEELRRGSTGQSVRVLQWHIGTRPDGKFGPKTEGAVEELQREKGLPVTGVVDRATWRAVLKLEC